MDERALAATLLDAREPGTLLTADRNFYSYDLWHQALDTGADLLWRVKSDLRLPVIRPLPDGSCLSIIVNPKISGKRRDQLIADARAGRDLPENSAAPVRVIEYTVPDHTGSGTGELICLITNILDQTDIPAVELATAYHERWEIENIFDEVKTHQRGEARVLRSKLPDLVEQEIWALLLSHYAIRSLMCEAADEADVDPDRLSFMRSLRVVRRQVTDQADFSP